MASTILTTMKKEFSILGIYVPINYFYTFAPTYKN